MASDSTHPPEFDSSNVLSLSAQKDSKIIHASVYANRAEITRLFKFDVKTGQNQVNIVDLPVAIDPGSFRVEGRGSATIYDVTLFHVPQEAPPTTSERLEELQAELTKTTKALARANKALASLEVYLQSLDSQHLDVTKLQSIAENYELAAEKLDAKATELEGIKARLDKDIHEEKKALAGPQVNAKLLFKSAISIFADFEGEVEIALIYAVHSASWYAQYDVRVTMDSKSVGGKSVDLIYKGAITQATGEDWTDVPITLETAAPTFGVGIPQLSPWNVSVAQPPQPPAIRRSRYYVSHRRSSSRSRSRDSSSSGSPRYRRPSAGASTLPMPGMVPPPTMGFRGLDVTSRGNMTATFSVPGLMSIPSDNVPHNVTIVKLDLDAKMEWVTVPKLDGKVHLKATIKNLSEYTLLSGPASVYVDGSFISRTTVPDVSPEESFDCPLGLDPSIRVTYQPVIKKVSQTGLMTKSNNYVYTQRISLQNTKSLTIGNLKVIDQIPVSQNSDIVVKIVSPALESLPDNAAGSVASTIKGGLVENKAGVKIPAPVKISQGVIAQWEGADEVSSEDDADSIGKDGKVNWTCSLPPQGKLVLTLQWKVSAPLKTNITGL